MSRALDGTNPVAYLGVRPLTPPNMIVPGLRPTSQPRNPTQNDIQYNLGDHWLNTNTQGLWYLAALGSHLVGGINTRFATWLQFSTSLAMNTTLTGNFGGLVLPDLGGNFNVVGDLAVGIQTIGNLAANTLTITTVGGLPIAQTETGNSGGAVPFSAGGNMNVIGDTTVGLTVAGTPGTNTLLITSVGGHHFAESETGDVGGAVFFDAVGNLNVKGGVGSGIVVDGTVAPNTLTITTTGGHHIAESLTGDVGGAIFFDAAGNMNLLTGHAANAAGASVLFSGAVNTMSLKVSDASNNTLVGNLSGNLTLSGTDNTGLGVSTLHALTTGQFNTAIGSGALNQITTGTSNTALGVLAGSNYTGAESNNISIGGGVAGTIADSNTLRVGLATGAGAGELNRSFVQGIYGITPALSPAVQTVIIDANGQLGSAAVGVTGFTSIVIQTFTSNGTYTPTAGMQYCIIEAVGGGGGAGGATATGVGEVSASAGGGGGGYSRGVYSAATIGVSKAVTIGAGGAGAAGSGDGTGGGTTTVGVLIQATGGGGSFHSDHKVGFIAAFGGPPGVGSLGSVNIQGEYGGPSFGGNNGANFSLFAGTGGGSFYGSGIRGGATTVAGTAAGNNATAYGGGGSGAGSSQSSGTATGGNGSAGIVVITEYI